MLLMVHKKWGYHKFFAQQENNLFKEWKGKILGNKIKQPEF